MNPLHLLWICPLSALIGMASIAIFQGLSQASEFSEALYRDGDGHEFIPTGIDHTEN